jgi:putative ABC transport system substrate-binding protein
MNSLRSLAGRFLFAPIRNAFKRIQAHYADWGKISIWFVGEFRVISLLGGAAAWPLAVRAQQPAMPVVAFITNGSPDDSASVAAAFRKGLNETGYVEGQNVMVEYHWLDGRFDRLPSLMADLVRRRVAVIATPGQTAAAQAAKAATTTIPIVFGVGEDPVKIGLVSSLARPGGNATGINYFVAEVVPKRLGLLHELVPKAVRIAALVNPSNAPVAEVMLRDLLEAARALGLQIQVLNASTSREIEAAFATSDRADALFIAPDGFFTSRRSQFVTLASRDRITGRPCGPGAGASARRRCGTAASTNRISAASRRRCRRPGRSFQPRSDARSRAICRLGSPWSRDGCPTRTASESAAVHSTLAQASSPLLAMMQASRRFLLQMYDSRSERAAKNPITTGFSAASASRRRTGEASGKPAYPSCGFSLGDGRGDGKSGRVGPAKRKPPDQARAIPGFERLASGARRTTLAAKSSSISGLVPWTPFVLTEGDSNE